MTQTLSFRLAAVLGALLGFASVASAQARTFRARGDGGSRIQFVSDAPLETMTGVSSNVSSELSVDPNDSLERERHHHRPRLVAAHRHRPAR